MNKQELKCCKGFIDGDLEEYFKPNGDLDYINAFTKLSKELGERIKGKKKIIKSKRKRRLIKHE